MRFLEDLGIKLENVTPSLLGCAKKAVIDKENSTIIDGAGKKEIEARVTQIIAANRGKPPLTTTRKSCRAIRN